MCVCIYIYIYIYIYIHTFDLRGWRNTVGNLIEFFWSKKPLAGLISLAIICVKHRGVRFHRIYKFKQYYFNSIPPTSHLSLHIVFVCVCVDLGIMISCTTAT